MDTIWIIVIAVVVLLVLWVISAYNGLVVARNKVKDLFSQIDVQLKRRADLIPNLVETVKGYAKHEENTFKEVIEARSGYMSADSASDKIASADQMTQAVSKIMALAEAYPELKANENFKELQSDLKETEDKIAYSRQFYNDSVMGLNNKIETFPSNIIAGMFHFESSPFFKAEEKDKENVKVKF